MRQEVELHPTSSGVTPAPSIRKEVEGEPDEFLFDVLTRSFGPTDSMYGLVVPREDGTLELLGIVDDHVMFGYAVTFADGAVLHIDNGGRGGSALPLMWDLLGDASTLAWILGGGAAALKWMEERKLKNCRTAAGDWIDDGVDSEPSMALKQQVAREREWERSKFDATFRLDRHEGSKLLRDLGYRKVRRDPDFWMEEALGGPSS